MYADASAAAEAPILPQSHLHRKHRLSRIAAAPMWLNLLPKQHIRRRHRHRLVTPTIEMLLSFVDVLFAGSDSSSQYVAEDFMDFDGCLALKCGSCGCGCGDSGRHAIAFVFFVTLPMAAKLQ